MKMNKTMVLVISLLILALFSWTIFQIWGKGADMNTKEIIQLLTTRIQNGEKFNSKEVKLIDKYFDRANKDDVVKRIDSELSVLYVRYLVERESLTETELNDFVAQLNQLESSIR